MAPCRAVISRDDGLVEFRRQRIRGVEGDVTGARVEHREPTRQIPAQLSQHLGRRRLPDRLPDDVVHPFRHGHPAPVACRVGDGTADGRESDGVGHDHHRELQGVGQCRRGGGERRGGGIQPDHQAAHSLVHQTADQCGLTACRLRQRPAVLHQQLTTGQPGPGVLQVGRLSPDHRCAQPGTACANLKPQVRCVDEIGDQVRHRWHFRRGSSVGNPELHGRHRCSVCGRTA